MRVEQYINGIFELGEGKADFIIDPARGARLAEVRSASEEQVERAFDAASRSFPTWSRMAPSARSEVLLKIADRLEQAFKPLAELEALNTGKPLNRVIQDELATIVDPFRFFAGAIRCQQSAASAEYVSGFLSTIRREPIGVVGLIIPWNYPLMMACWKIAPALAAGNTIVLKPAEQTPLSIIAAMEVIGDLLPPGTLNVVTGSGREVGRMLSSHPACRLVSITGSIATGGTVAANAAQSIKRVHLELGGKAPVIVYPDADLEEAAKTACNAGFYNAGQDCTAACRIFVHADIADAFTTRYVAEVERLKTGVPDDPDLSYGSLISMEHLNRVDAFVKKGLTDKSISTLLYQERNPNEPGCYYYPTVFDQVPFDHELVQKEVFGPVTTITTFGDSDPVLDWCNQTEYGLAASVWTTDHQRALRASQILEYGCVWINTHLLWPTEMPHGGFKQSGYGKEMSIHGLEDYQNIKHVMSRT